VPKVKKQVNIGGNRHTIESYDPEALQTAIDYSYQDPAVQRLFQYNFEKKHANTNWESAAAEHINAFKTTAEDNLNKAYALQQASQQGTPEYVKYGSLVDKYSQAVERYNTMLSDPQGHVDEFKNSVLQEEIRAQKEADIANTQFYSDEAVEADQFALEATQLNNALYQHQQNTVFDALAVGALSTGVNPSKINLNTPEGMLEAQKAAQSTVQVKKNKGMTAIESLTDNVMKSAYKKAYANGLDVFDDSGELIPIQDLPSFPGKPSATDKKIKDDMEAFSKGANSDAQAEIVKNYIKANYQALGFTNEPDKVELENGKISVENAPWLSKNEKKTFTVDEILNATGFNTSTNNNDPLGLRK